MRYDWMATDEFNEHIQMVADAFGVKPKYRVLSRPVIRVAGLFDSNIRESYEMLYQNDSEYLFDSTKFSKAFSFEPTSYVEGIKRTALAYKSPIV
jgi:nucleoside-diphosphate-sugar epimerase